MPTNCAVKLCENTFNKCKGKDVKFFRFPRNENFQREWVEACGRKLSEINVKNARICSTHFEADCYAKTLQQIMLNYSPSRFRKLKDNAMPTKNLFWKQKIMDSALDLNDTFTVEKRQVEQNSDSEISSHISESTVIDNTLHENKIEYTNSSINSENVIATKDCQVKHIFDVCAKNTNTSDFSTVNKEGEKTVFVSENTYEDSKVPNRVKVNIIKIQDLNKSDSTYLNLCDMQHLIIKQKSDYKINKITNNSIPHTTKTITTNVISPSINKTEVQELREQLKIMKVKYEKAQQTTRKLRNVNVKIAKRVRRNTVDEIKQALSKVFTPNQINILLTPTKTKTHWSADDMASAISLRCVSSETYHYLKYTMNFPLPAASTIRRWVANVDLNRGILHNVLKMMKYKGTTMPDVEKLTILSFDEIQLSDMDTERKKQKILNSNKSCQVVMVRGLLKKWKQLIFYDFDQPITKEVLLDLISQLHECGFMVVGITCNLSPKNKEVWRSLKVDLDDPTNCSFSHPCDETSQIFTFFDVSHMLKSLRNHFIDEKCHIDEKCINKSILEQVLQINDTETNFCYKLQQYHIDVQGSERLKVKPAAQLFSKSVAKNIEYWGHKGRLEQSNWKEAVAFIMTVNYWFDLFNKQYDFSNAYGNHLITQQNALLLEMTQYMNDIRFGQHRSMIECQKGIIRSNKSLENLLKYIQLKYPSYNIKYILTSSLNQDGLKNLFSYLKTTGSTNCNQSALDIQQRIRWFILGKHSTTVFSSGMNTTKEPLEENLIDMRDSVFEDDVFENINEEIEIEQQ